MSFNPLEIYPKNNTNAIFYNCADIALESDTRPRPASSPKNSTAPRNTTRTPQAVGADPRDPRCTSPSLWEATAVTTSSVGIVNHHIWYDAIRQRVRWDRSGALWNSTDNELSLITNYSDLNAGPPEYVIYPRQNQCAIYGADAFYAWQYGSQMAMRWVCARLFSIYLSICFSITFIFVYIRLDLSLLFISLFPQSLSLFSSRYSPLCTDWSDEELYSRFGDGCVVAESLQRIRMAE